METKSLLILLGLLLHLGPYVWADAGFDREMKEAKEQYERAVKEAVEPVNQRYREVLEGFQKRAIASRDAAAEKKIKDEMDALTSPTVGGTAKAQGTERKSLLSILSGTTWGWNGEGGSLKFNPDGTIKYGKESGQWVPGKDGTVIISDKKKKKGVLKLVDEKHFDGTGFDGAAVAGSYSWGGQKR